MFVICHFLFALFYLSLALCYVFSWLCSSVYYSPSPYLSPQIRKLHFSFKPINISSFKPMKDTFQGKNMNCGQLLLLRITQPLPWWLPFWGNQTLLQMTGSESWLLSFYMNRNVVGKINRGIPMLLIQSNTIRVKKTWVCWVWFSKTIVHSYLS